MLNDLSTLEYDEEMEVVTATFSSGFKKHVNVGFWEKPDDTHTVIRFATSWATTEEELIELEKYL